MLKFEKLLADNQMSENDPDFPSGAAAKMAKIRKYQQDIETADADQKAEILEKINKIDDELIAKLEDYFEVIDEEEEKKKAKIASDKAKADKDAADKAAADKAKADKVAADKAAADKAKADKDASDKAAADKAKADKAASDKAAADKAKADKDAQEAEDAKPATTNEGALAKLFKKGKTSGVTMADLKAAGFDTGWFGPIGANGCTQGAYRLSRDNQYVETFTLSKIG